MPSEMSRTCCCDGTRVQSNPQGRQNNKYTLTRSAGKHDANAWRYSTRGGTPTNHARYLRAYMHTSVTHKRGPERDRQAWAREPKSGSRDNTYTEMLPCEPPPRKQSIPWLVLLTLQALPAFAKGAAFQNIGRPTPSRLQSSRISWSGAGRAA